MIDAQNNGGVDSDGNAYSGMWYYKTGEGETEEHHLFRLNTRLDKALCTYNATKKQYELHLYEARVTVSIDPVTHLAVINGGTGWDELLFDQIVCTYKKDGLTCRNETYKPNEGMRFTGARELDAGNYTLVVTVTSGTTKVVVGEADGGIHFTVD